MVAVLEIKIFYITKLNYMKILIVIWSLLLLWMSYEIWRAPLMEETDDGRLITKRPARKLSDLWRKRH